MGQTVLKLQGKARLDALGDPAGQRAALLLQCKSRTCRSPAESTDGTYTAAIDLGRASDGGPLPESIWTMRFAVTIGRLQKEAWLPRPEGPAYEALPEPRIIRRGAARPMAVTAFHSDRHGRLNLGIGASRFPLGRDARGSLRQGRLGRATVEVAATAPRLATHAGVQLVYTARGGHEPFAVEAVADVDAAGRITARVLLRAVPPGAWENALRLRDNGFCQDIPATRVQTAPCCRCPRPRRSAADTKVRRMLSLAR